MLRRLGAIDRHRALSSKQMGPQRQDCTGRKTVGPWKEAAAHSREGYGYYTYGPSLPLTKERDVNVTCEYDHAAMQTVIHLDGTPHVIDPDIVAGVSRVRMFDRDKLTTHPLLIKYWYKPLLIPAA